MANSVDQDQTAPFDAFFLGALRVNMHVQPASGAMSLNFGLGLHRFQFFSDGSRGGPGLFA